MKDKGYFTLSPAKRSPDPLYREGFILILIIVKTSKKAKQSKRTKYKSAGKPV